MRRALAAMAERGVNAEAQERLETSYYRFHSGSDPVLRNEAGKDVIRAIFGRDAVTEDSVRSSAAATLGASSRTCRRAAHCGGGPNGPPNRSFERCAAFRFRRQPFARFVIGL